MPVTTGENAGSRPVLLCFDGSPDSAAAITQAGRLLSGSAAVVLTVDEPLATWDAYDPATIVSAPLSRLASKALDVDEIAREVAQELIGEGVTLARAAGFEAEGRTATGKAWRTICDIAEELDACVIVMGARGLSRVKSVLLGSASAAVGAHTRRPVLIVPPAPGDKR
jgi:nucleotide-binding universal stress UspA family protein